MSATDGMLEGFFNLLDKMDWQCDSMPLERPGSLPSTYIAQIQVKSLVKDPTQNPRSELFAEDNGTYMLLPGFEQRSDGRYVRAWNETMLHAKGIDAYWTTYDMTPGMAELRVKTGGMQLEMDVMDGGGYKCAVMEAPKGALENTGGISGNDLSLEFMGIQESQGVVLRHFRMHLTQELEKRRRLRRLAQGNGTNTQDLDQGAAMMKAGTIPNVMDYFDVDSDPSGKLEAGAPFRLRFFSTVSGSAVWSEKTFLSFVPLDGNRTTKDVLDHFGVQRIENFVNKASGCACDKKYDSAAADAACAVVNKFPDTAGKAPPRLDPYTEDPATVSFYRSKLMVDVLAEIKGEGSTKELTLAMQTHYWSNVLYKDAYGELLTAAVNHSNRQTTDGNKTSPDRRLLGTTYNKELNDNGFTLDVGGDAGAFGMKCRLAAEWSGKLTDFSGSSFGCAPINGVWVCGGGGFTWTNGIRGHLDVSASLGVCCGVSVNAGMRVEASTNSDGCLTQLYAKPYVSVWNGDAWASIRMSPEQNCNYDWWNLEIRAGYNICPWWCYSDDFRIAHVRF